MIPEVGRQHLADFIDVFCDEGFFTPKDTSRILEAGAKWGMIPNSETSPIGNLIFYVKYDKILSNCDSSFYKRIS